MKILGRILIVIALAGVVTGCGVRLAYNNIDWLVMRWVDRQVTLEPGQDLAFRQALDNRMQWHCASELPDYVSFVRALEHDINENEVTVERLMVHGEQLSKLGERLLTGLQPAVIELLASLNDEQVAEILEGVDKRIADLREEAYGISEQQRRQDTVDSMERTLRRLLGQVTEGQYERLQQWAAELEPTAELALSQRIAWRQRFARALDYRHDPEIFSELASALLTPGADWSDEFEARMAFNSRRTIEAMVDIHHMASERQFRRLRSRLNSLANSFRRLSCA